MNKVLLQLETDVAHALQEDVRQWRCDCGFIT